MIARHWLIGLAPVILIIGAMIAAALAIVMDSDPVRSSWEYEVGDHVRHVSGVEAVVVDRNYATFYSLNLLYFIRYRNNVGSLETLRAISEEIELLED
jgi:hypothetical protein